MQALLQALLSAPFEASLNELLSSRCHGCLDLRDGLDELVADDFVGEVACGPQNVAQEKPDVLLTWVLALQLPEFFAPSADRREQPFDRPGVAKRPERELRKRAERPGAEGVVVQVDEVIDAEFEETT